MDLKDVYKLRENNSHKGDFGNVLIVGGSQMYSGSPIFNAMAALRAGADLITVVGHHRAMNVVAAFSPDMITVPLEEEFGFSDVDTVLELSEKFDTLVIGGGMKRSEESYEAIRDLILKIELPMVIDAEAIRAVAEDLDILENKEVILTPNVPEFETIVGESVSDILGEREKQVERLAKELKCIVLLKGHVDIISDGNRIIANETGNSYMTKGGFGDVLAGICGALLVRDIDFLRAGEVAAYISGRAGELASENFKESVLASDALGFISTIIKESL